MESNMKRQLTICSLLLLTFKYTPGCPATCSCTIDSRGTIANCYSKHLGYFPTNFPSNTYHIDVRSNGIKTVIGNLCKLYPNLEILYLGNNQLTYIPADVFADCGNLLELYHSDNDITDIHVDAFVNLKKLKLLYLYNNKLPSIGASAFRNLNNLERLHMANNKLSSFGVPTFSNLSKLRYLYLYLNDITDIHVDTFVNLSNLRTLHLDSNKLTTVSSSVFRNMNNLYQLLLYDNRLTSLSASTFRNMNKLSDLRLQNNNITEFKGGLWENKNLDTLDMTGNPLLCDCGIRSFYEWAIVTTATVSGAQCTSGQDVVDIHQDYFRLCTYWDCYNDGFCVMTETNSTSCKCGGNLAEDKCQGRIWRGYN